MASLIFDTLKFANRLKAAGVDPAHAEAEACALAGVLDGNLPRLATRDDLRDLATKAEVRELATRDEVAELRTEVRELRADFEGKFRLLQWMLGVTIAGVATLVTKALL